MLLLGFGTQARADYVEEGDGWETFTVEQEGIQSATPNYWDSSTNGMATRLWYKWEPADPQDAPVPVQLQLSYTASLSGSSVTGDEWTYAGNSAQGGFSSGNYYSHEIFDYFNGAFGVQPTSEAKTSDFLVFKLYDEENTIYEFAQAFANVEVAV